MVKINEIRESFILNKLWCDQVTVTPLANKIEVLRRGTWKGSTDKTWWGGQIEPNSKPGFNLLWKKAQNQAEKNKISLKINKIMPHLRPSRTSKLWNPVSLSRETSRHQVKLVKNTTKKKINKKKLFLVLKKINKFKIIVKTIKETKIGQGLRDTKWNLWKWIFENYLDPN